MIRTVTTCIRDIPVPGQRLCGLAWLDGLLWYSDAGLEQILALDPETGQIRRRLACPAVRTDLAIMDGRLLQIAGAAKSLRLIDPESGETLDEFPNPRPGAELCGLEVGDAGIWMGYRDPPIVDLRLPRDFRLIDSIPVEENVAGLTVVGGHVVFANHPDRRINVLDPASRRIVRRINVDGNPTGLTAHAQCLWYCDYSNIRVRAVDLQGLLEPE